MKEAMFAFLPFVIIPPLLIGVWAAIQRRRHPPSSHAMEAAALLGDPRWLTSGWAGMTFILVYAAVYSVRRFVTLPVAAKAALLAVPVLVFAWFIYTFVREARKGDEFAQRVRLEALSYAFCAFLCFAMSMWLINEIDPAPRRGTYEMSLGFLPLFYFVGLFFAKARYLPISRSNDENR